MGGVNKGALKNGEGGQRSLAPQYVFVPMPQYDCVQLIFFVLNCISQKPIPRKILQYMVIPQGAIIIRQNRCRHHATNRCVIHTNYQYFSNNQDNENRLNSHIITVVKYFKIHCVEGITKKNL